MRKMMALFLIILTGIAATGCTKAVMNQEKKVEIGKKVVIVAAQEYYSEDEFIACYEPLKNQGVDIKIASTVAGELIGDQLNKIDSDVRIQDITVHDYDMLIVMGGYGTVTQLIDNQDLHKLIAEAYNKEKMVGAICAGAAVLAKAGILKDKEATGSMTELMEEAGAQVLVDEDIVQSGRIFTGKGEAYMEFADKALEMLGLRR